MRGDFLIFFSQTQDKLAFLPKTWLIITFCLFLACSEEGAVEEEKAVEGLASEKTIKNQTQKRKKDIANKIEQAASQLEENAATSEVEVSSESSVSASKEASQPLNEGEVSTLLEDKSLALTSAKDPITALNAANYLMQGSCLPSVTDIEISYFSLETLAHTEKTSCEEGVFSVTSDLSSLPEGQIDISIDYSKKEGPVQYAILKDATAPRLTGVTNDPTVTNKKTFTLDCGEPCLFSVSVDKEPNSVPDGPFTEKKEFSFDTGNGAFYFHAVAKDAQGNLSLIHHASFELDTIAPSAPTSLSLTAPASNTGSLKTPTLSVGGVLATDLVGLFFDGACTNLVADFTATSDNQLITLPALEDGDHTFYANRQDAAGNVSSCSAASVSYTLDSIKPNAPSSLALKAPLTSPSNVKTPEIVVSGVVSGDTIELYKDITCTNQIASGVATGSNITLTPSSPLEGGTYTFYATASDKAGNKSSCSLESLTYALDLTAPSAPHSLSMHSPASNISNDDTPKIELLGTQSEDTISLFTDAACTNQIASSIASSTSIILTLNTLEEGTYNFYAKAKDPAGNESLCGTDTVSYTVDKTKPEAPSALSLVSPNKSPASDDTPSIHIDGLVAGDTVSLFTDALCESKVAEESAAGADHTLTPPTLTEGTYTFYAQSKDEAGNISDCSSQSITYTLDKTSPSAPTSILLKSPINSPGNLDTPEFTISDVSLGDTIKIFSDASCTAELGSKIADSTSLDITSQTLAEGSYTIYASAEDAAGNTSLCSEVFASYQLDKTPPSTPGPLTLSDPTSSISNDTTPTIQVGGTAAGGTIYLFSDASCTLQLASTVAEGASTLITSSPLTDASYSFYAKAIDSAGNASLCSESSASYTLDTTPPVAPSSLTLTSPAQSPSSLKTPTITVSGVVSGDTVKLYTDSDCSMEVASGDASASSIDLTTSSLADGSYTFYAMAVDKALNSSACSLASTDYVLDSIAPSAPSALSLKTPSTSPGLNTSIEITVSSVQAGDMITLYTGSACAAQAASKIATLSTVDIAILDLTEGSHTFYAKVQDPAGNLSACSSAHISYELDTTPPPTPNTLSLIDPATSPANNPAPKVSVGNVVSSDIVSIYDNASCTNLLGSKAASDTSVTITLNPLEEGIYHFYAASQDAAGNKSACSVDTITYDLQTTPPDPIETFSLISPQSVFSKTGDITIEALNLTIGTTIKLFADQSCEEELASHLVSATSETILHSLASNGSYSFSLSAIDNLGNQSSCSVHTIPFTFDNQISDPTGMSIVSPSQSPSNVTTPQIEVIGPDLGDTVKIYTSAMCFGSSLIGTGTASAGLASVDVTAGKLINEGTYTFYTRTQDATGNITACSSFFVSYSLDTTPPNAPTSVTVSAPAATGTDDTPTVDVSGLTAGDTVHLYKGASCAELLGKKIASASSLSFETDPLANEGYYEIYATSKDPAGNESACSTAFDTYTLDLGIPTLTSVNLESAAQNPLVSVGGKAILTFTANEPLLSSQVTIAGRQEAATLLTGTTYQAVTTMLASDSDGPVSFSIDFKDESNNNGLTVTETSDGSSLTFNSNHASPAISILDQNIFENNLFSLNVNDINSGLDEDVEGDPLTYSCYIDTTINGHVSAAASCLEAGFAFDATLGSIQFTPDFTQAGLYEIRVTAFDGTYHDEDIFLLTVHNNNRLATLTTIEDQIVEAADNISFDIDDTQTASDVDPDGEALTYSCVYDDTDDDSVANGQSCEGINGLEFSITTGIFNWTISDNNIGTYEIKISANDGIETVDTLFTVTVISPLSKKQLALAGSNSTSYIASLGDNNVITLRGGEIGTYNRGDIITDSSTNKGDILECSKGCAAITDALGTASWSTALYSDTLLSTYMGRYSAGKFTISSFDQPVNIAIKQEGVTLATGSIAANSVTTYNLTYSVGALWIESDFPISAFVSTHTNYERDSRIITAADENILAFTSGSGGTPTGVSAVGDNTTFSAYRNDGTDFLDRTINIEDIVLVTSSARQNGPLSAIAVYGEKPVVATQHADSDGVNATPSLPKRMLPTHFVVPMDSDYISFASYEQAQVRVINSSNTVTNTLQMTKQPGAHDKAPYAVTYNISNIKAGTQFVCTSPCLAILEPLNNDETLLTGRLRDAFSLTSSSFQDGGEIPSRFTGQRSLECSGDNDFPNLTLSNIPWGTKSLVLIVEDTTNSNFVHLNLTDIDPATTSLGTIEASSGSVTFPSGLEGINDYNTSGWSGPCTAASLHTYRFNVFALSASLGSPINQMNSETFLTTYSATILGSATMNATHASE